MENIVIRTNLNSSAIQSIPSTEVLGRRVDRLTPLSLILPRRERGLLETPFADGILSDSTRR
ncbi:Transcriptional regulator [Giardia duodenalis assemblage B]|uniref:Transcriptional regulator n=1 Tax=Giardia duodenalis assemblage B TaxID=1394984 RepID=A0A132NMZ4_GIAIN|nr:Transcriptional regulator [Giardia intestinalis assemblage B]